MKFLFRLTLVLLVLIACWGLYQGWFYFSTSGTDHKSSATITVDKEKIRADEGRAKEKVEEFGQKVKKTTGDRTGSVTEGERPH
jgi:hypothetical protein